MTGDLRTAFTCDDHDEDVDLGVHMLADTGAGRERHHIDVEVCRLVAPEGARLIVRPREGVDVN